MNLKIKPFDSYNSSKPLNPDEEAAKRESVRIINHIKNSKTVDELKKCEEAMKHQDQVVSQLFNRKLELLNEKS